MWRRSKPPMNWRLIWNGFVLGLSFYLGVIAIAAIIFKAAAQ